MFKGYLSGCLFAGVFVAVFGLHMADSAAAVVYPPLAGVQGLALDLDRGVESLYVTASADQGTSFTDSSCSAKTVINTESYDSYTKLMLHIENNVTDSAAGKTVTNNNVTFTSSIYKMGGYSGVFNGSKIQPR